MAVRLSDISSKTGKKCIFCVFRSFLSLCRTASLPYRLSHISPLHQSILPIFMIILVSSKRVSVRNNLLHSVLGLACSGRPHSAIIKRILFDKDNNAPSAWWRPCGASAVVATADNVIKPNSLSFSN